MLVIGDDTRCKFGKVVPVYVRENDLREEKFSTIIANYFGIKYLLI